MKILASPFIEFQINDFPSYVVYIYLQLMPIHPMHMRLRRKVVKEVGKWGTNTTVIYSILSNKAYCMHVKQNI